MKRALAGRAARALVVAVLVLSAVAAGVGGLASAQDGNATDSAEAPDGLDLDALEERGTQRADAAPGVRVGGTFREYRLMQHPTGLITGPKANYSSWVPIQRASTTVKRNYVRIYSKRGYDLDDMDVVVRVATYQKRRVQVEGGNSTEVQATNVTTRQVNASLSDGRDFVEIDLPAQYHQSFRAVVCIQQPGEANCLREAGATRWHFQHASSKATMPTNINSAGDLVTWGLMVLFLPFLMVGSVSLYGTNAAIQRAESKPSIPWWVWPATFIGGTLGLFLGWDLLVGALVRSPWMLGVVGGLALGVVAAFLFGDNDEQTLFLRLRANDWTDVVGDLRGPRQGEPRTDGGTAADSDSVFGFDDDDDGGTATDSGSVFGTGGDSPTPDAGGSPDPSRTAPSDGTMDDLRDADPAGSIKLDAIPVKTANGRHISDGFWNWVARARGADSPIRAADSDRIKTDVDIGLGPFDQAYFLDPEADEEEVLKAQEERHVWEFPELVSKDADGWHVNGSAIVGTMFTVGMSTLLGTVVLGTAEVGLLVGLALVALWKVATPRDGYLEARLAPTHYHRAVGTILAHAEELGNLKTWQSLFRENVQEKTSNRAENRSLQAEGSRSQLDEIADQHLGTERGQQRDQDLDAEADPEDREVSADD